MHLTTGAARRTPQFAVLLAIALAVSACGSGSDSGDDNQVASLTGDEANEAGGGDADAAADESESEPTFEDASLAFAVCMREAGIAEWPDPAVSTEGGRPFGDVDFADLGIDPSSTEFQETLDSCRGEFEGVVGGREGLTPEEEAEQLDQQIAIAECVRENPGWEDFPDPDPNGGGFAGVRELFQSGEFDPAEFRTIQQDCAAELGLEAGAGFGRGAGGNGP